MPFSRGSPWPGDQTHVLYISALAGRFFLPLAPTQENGLASTSYLQGGWEAQENGLASTSYLQGGWGRGLSLTFHRLDCK